MEMQHFLSNDGFLDRWLMISTRPHLSLSTVTKEFHHVLERANMKDFVKPMKWVYEQHKGRQTEYRFSEDAQLMYDEMVDAYVNYINHKYDSDSGENLPLYMCCYTTNIMKYNNQIIYSNCLLLHTANCYSN